MPSLSVSYGELLDRQTILELKLFHCAHEIRDGIADALDDIHAEVTRTRADLDAVEAELDELRRINANLWKLEDDVRALIARGDIAGSEFVDAARAIPSLNDARAACKAVISRKLGGDGGDRDDVKVYGS